MCIPDTIYSFLKLLTKISQVSFNLLSPATTVKGLNCSGIAALASKKYQEVYPDSFLAYKVIFQTFIIQIIIASEEVLRCRNRLR